MFSLSGRIRGEVIRRSVGGEWSADDGDPEGEINIELHLSDGSVIWPIRRVMKRLANGPEDSLLAYGAAVGLDLRSATEPPRRWWRR